MTSSCIIVQITDPHVGRSIRYPSGKVYMYDELVKTVNCIKEMNSLPDLVLVSGDLAHHGNVSDYDKSKTLLDTLGIPYYLAAGNHDVRSAMREVFKDHTYLFSGTDYIQYTIEYLPVRIIVLDTLAVGSHRGLLDQERLAWIDKKLNEQRERDTLICMHHPPFETGMPYPDHLGLDGIQELGEIIRSYHNVGAVISGHTHRDSSRLWNGTVAYVTPSCSFSYDLEFNEVEDVDPLNEPPAVRVLRWDSVSGIISHLCYTHTHEYGVSEGVPAAPEN